MIGIRGAAAAAALTAFCIAPPARAQLYTTYGFSPTQFSWITCGQIPGYGGCFGSGIVGPFGHLCAVIQDNDRAKGGNDGSTQRIYLMDSNATGKNDVVLHVMQKKIVVSGDSATTTYMKVSDLALPLVGGGACQAAANKVAILAGTSLSSNAAYIAKKGLAASSFGGFEPPEDVTSIISDASGYIIVNFSGGSYLVAPDGSIAGSGGATDIIPKDNALLLP